MDLGNEIIGRKFTFFSLFLLRILDVATTHIAVYKGAVEVNPITKIIYDAVGANNIIYTLPLQVIIVAITVFLIYYVIGKTSLNSNNQRFFYCMFNSLIIMTIFFNFIVPINNILVIGGLR